MDEPGQDPGGADFWITNPDRRKERAYGGGNTKARGGSFTPVPETPAVGVRADMRPRVKNGSGKVTTAKAGK